MEQGDISLFFLYDQNGLFGFDKISGTTKNTFYYRIDARGEIVAIVNAYGNVVANYTYDAWGSPISVTNGSGNSDLDSTHVALLNPFRYKSYVYDNETELYYLNSRYYDPQVCRFVSRDDFEYLGIYVNPLTCNLFVYSLNNPVNYVDSSGELAYLYNKAFHRGTIHNEVVKHVADKYNYYREQIIIYDAEEYPHAGSYGRADIISPAGEVWEVKRDRIKQIEKGKKQVERYVNNTWYDKNNTHNVDKLTIGGDSIKSGFFYYKRNLTTYKVTYRYVGDGVIAYDYNKAKFNSELLKYYSAVGAGVFMLGFARGIGYNMMPLPEV